MAAAISDLFGLVGKPRGRSHLGLFIAWFLRTRSSRFRRRLWHFLKQTNIEFYFDSEVSAIAILSVYIFNYFRNIIANFHLRSLRIYRGRRTQYRLYLCSQCRLFSLRLLSTKINQLKKRSNTVKKRKNIINCSIQRRITGSERKIVLLFPFMKVWACGWEQSGNKI